MVARTFSRGSPDVPHRLGPAGEDKKARGQMPGAGRTSSHCGWHASLDDIGTASGPGYLARSLADARLAAGRSRRRSRQGECAVTPCAQAARDHGRGCPRHPDNGCTGQRDGAGIQVSHRPHTASRPPSLKRQRHGVAASVLGVLTWRMLCASCPRLDRRLTRFAHAPALSMPCTLGDLSVGPTSVLRHRRRDRECLRIRRRRHVRFIRRRGHRG